MSLDLVQELQLRRWARMNYVPRDDRDPNWDTIILTEMALKDRELADQQLGRSSVSNFVPLEPTQDIRIDSAEVSLKAPRFSKVVAPYEILVHR